MRYLKKYWYIVAIIVGWYLYSRLKGNLQFKNGGGLTGGPLGQTVSPGIPAAGTGGEF